MGGGGRRGGGVICLTSRHAISEIAVPIKKEMQAPFDGGNIACKFDMKVIGDIIGRASAAGDIPSAVSSRGYPLSRQQQGISPQPSAAGDIPSAVSSRGYPLSRQQQGISPQPSAAGDIPSAVSGVESPTTHFAPTMFQTFLRPCIYGHSQSYDYSYITSQSYRHSYGHSYGHSHSESYSSSHSYTQEGRR